MALAGIFLIEITCSIETLNENNIKSNEPINKINYSVQGENNNNSSSSYTVNDQVANNSETQNQSLSGDNAMEISIKHSKHRKILESEFVLANFV